MSQKTLDADLDILQRSGIEISIDPLTHDMDIIQALDDEPNDVGGLTAQELKAKFDEAGNIIKKYINETLVPEVLSEGATEAQRQANEAARQAAETSRQTAEAGRAAAEQGRVSAEAGRAAALATFTGGVTASAKTLPYSSPATARAVPEGGSFRLEIGVPQGMRGVAGPQGERGIDGVALAADGLWAFNVSQDGHLIVSYTGRDAPDMFIDDSGHLILRF